MAEKFPTDKIEPRSKSVDLTPSQKAQRTKQGKKRAEEIQQLWQRANTAHRVKWEIMEQKAYDFVLNDQLTEQERTDLEASGMPTFIINRMTPVIETMKYFVTANNPRWKAVGTDGADADIADIHTGVIDYAWYISGGKSVLSQIVFDALVKGKGYMHIVVDPDADRGMGEVKFEFVDPFCVWTSPMSSDFLERDATYHIIKKDLPRESLCNMLPAYKDVIMAASANMNMGHSRSARSFDETESIQRPDVRHSIKAKDGSEDQILPYYEVYTPKKILLYNVFIKEELTDVEVQEARANIEDRIEQMTRELEVSLLEREQELTAALQRGEIIKERFDLEMQKAREEGVAQIREAQRMMTAAIEDQTSQLVEEIMTEEEYDAFDKKNVDKAIPFYEKRVMKSAVVGDKLLYEFTMNTKYIPLIPIPYLHTGTPNSMSAARGLVGKQQEINKSHQIMVHNANLSSNFRWKYVVGEINEEEWENYVASPNALLSYQPGYSQNGPEPVLPQNINNAFFTIEQDSKSDLEYMAGIHPPSMGMSSGNDETFRGFLARDEFATRRIKSWISNVFEPALEHIGLVFQDISKDVYTIHKVFRIVQPNPQGEIDQTEFEINVPIYDDKGEVIGRYNDYATGRYDIRIIAGSTLPVNRWAVLEEYKQYLELGIIDDIAFLQETDIKNKNAIIERKSAMAQLNQQVQQMDEMLKDANGTIETLERQLVQAGIKSKVQDASVEINAAKTEAKSQENLVVERMRDALKLAREELALAKRESELKVKEAQQKAKEAKANNTAKAKQSK